MVLVHRIDELTDRFRAEGLRVTPQRQALSTLLESNDGHPTVEALHNAARVTMPTLSLKTVYQTVHDLAAMGEVELLDLGTGSVRVDPNVDHPHHHLICTGCGAVRDVPADGAPPDLAPGWRDEFEVAAVEVNFRGRCGNCRARDPLTNSKTK